MPKVFVYILLISLLFIFTTTVAAQNGNIAGQVKDVEADQGVAGVIVEIKELEFSTKTNSKGEFLFQDVPEGNYSISLIAPGYGRTVRLNVLVFDNQTWYDQI